MLQICFPYAGQKFVFRLIYVINYRFSHLPGNEELQVLPDYWGQAVDCAVVGAELRRIEERGDPGVSLSILDRAECFAEGEFSENYSCQAL
jgi:hypothetical protein